MEAQITLKKQRLPFTQVPNDLLCSDKISGLAKALWCVLYSKPDSWVFYWREIETNFKEGKRALRNAKKELQTFGYLLTKQKRIFTGRGKEMKYSGMEMSLFYEPTLSPIQENQLSSESVQNEHSRNENSGIETSRSDATYKDLNQKDLLESNKEDINIKPISSIKTPLTPQKKEGVFKFEGGVSRLISMLSEDALIESKENAPGWDIYALAGVYIEGMGKRGGMPKDLNKAFPAWCKCYTKGKEL